MNYLCIVNFELSQFKTVKPEEIT